VDFAAAQDDRGYSGNKQNSKTCKAPDKSSPPAHQLPVFAGRMPFLFPTNSVKAEE